MKRLPMFLAVLLGFCIPTALFAEAPAPAAPAESAAPAPVAQPAPAPTPAPAPAVQAAPEPAPVAPVTPAPVSPVAVESAAPAAAPEPEPEPGKLLGNKYVEFAATLQTLFLIRNDTDFDSTQPYYNAEGQSVGVLGTFLKPRLTLKPIEELTIVHEMELGLNLWGHNDPDQYSTGAKDTFRLANRELYLDGRFFDGKLGFRVGYQHFTDPSGLFINHWIGAAAVSTDRGWGKFTLVAAQLPDQTYEGVTFQSNNFKHDTFLYGLRIDVPIEHWPLAIALYGFHDSQIIGSDMNLFTPSISLMGDYGYLKLGLDAAFQYGFTENAAVGGDEESIAYALQLFVDVENPLRAGGQKGGLDVEFHMNHLILSPDDDAVGNKHNGAFLYSGKNRSRTIMLSEDEIRDRGGNLDERLSEVKNKFYRVRPGLWLGDVTLGLIVADLFKPKVIVGAATVLNKDNALGNGFVGVEADLDLEIVYKKWLSFHLTGGLLAPGKAASAFVNLYDKEATNLQYQLETSLSAFF